MVVAARIQWVREQLQQGANATIHVGAALDQSRAKIRIVIQYGGAPTSLTARSLLLSTLDSVSMSTARFVSVDRGHKHSTGVSEVGIWLSEIPHAPGWKDGPPDDDHRGPDPPPPDNDPDNRRPRRGRSPPAPDADPWQDGHDPWSRNAAVAPSAGANPPRKTPRQQATMTTNTWRNWRPTSSSVTPDPPLIRSVHAAPPTTRPLRLPRIFHPPPLALHHCHLRSPRLP